MKGMAIVAILIALFELVNTGIELVAGGVSGRSGAELLGIGMIIVALFMLLAAGVNLIRIGRAATTLAIAASVASMVAFGFLGYTQPMLSRLAMLLGIGFPAALLVFLFVNRGNGKPVAA